MQTASQSEKPPIAVGSTPAQPRAKKPQRVSWESFEKRFLYREDGYTYEWSNGVVIKTHNSMGPNQLYIQFNLQEIFMRLKTAQKITGQLLAEPDILFTPDIHRRPDFAWLTMGQAINLTQNGAIEIPEFVIEVVSNNYVAQRLTEKLQLYRATGVKVVWFVFPNQEEIHVYAGKDLDQMTICFGEKICTAAPALPGFAFEAKELFRKTP